MASGEIYKGKNLRLSFDGKVLYHATSCSLSLSTALESIATKDTEGNKKTPGNYDWTLSTSALFAETSAENTSTHVGFGELIALQLQGAEIDVEFTTGEVGDVVFSGKAFIESCTVNAEVGNSAQGDFSFSGNGDLTKATVQ